MRKQQAIAALKKQRDAVKAFGATSLYLFGSTMRDEAEAASDLDLFVDYDQKGGFSLIELVGIKQLLEERLACPDLTSRDIRIPIARVNGLRRRPCAFLMRSGRPARRGGLEASTDRAAIRRKAVHSPTIDAATACIAGIGTSQVADDPMELQATQPDIPWSEITGIGNVLRHEYHRISGTPPGMWQRCFGRNHLGDVGSPPEGRRGDN